MNGRRRPFIVEGPVWCHFGYGEGLELDCASCERQFLETGRAPQGTRNCWKVQVWLGDVPDPEWLVSALVSAAGTDRSLLGKYSTGPIPADGPGRHDRALFLYFGDRASAEQFADRLVSMMEREGKAPCPGWRPRVRKGCWHFDAVAGPWETWDT
ncbi:MAG: hypothetical protein NUV93_07235 [Firmicutes bacterium]|nr:hypothetical protein [Bacillota bacterium]